MFIRRTRKVRRWVSQYRSGGKNRKKRIKMVQTFVKTSSVYWVQQTEEHHLIHWRA